MTGDLSINLGTAVSLFLTALALFVGVRSFRWIIHLLPVASRTRNTLVEAVPLLEIGLSGVYVLVAVERIFRGSPLFGGIAVVGVFFFALWLGGDSLRDVISGVLLRTSGCIGLGDRVRLDGLEGRVAALGYRVLTLELSGGDESLIPYSQLSRTAIVRTPHVFGAHRHTFRLPTGTDAERVRQTVLLCHWSSVSRQPVIEPGDDGLDVTVFALEPDHGVSVERFVREHVG